MICITGGSGFIGTALGQRLAERQQLFQNLDIRPVQIAPDRRVDCDICDLQALRRQLQGETVIHLAALHRDDVRPLSRYHQVNVTGTENIARVAREKGIERIVFASTVAVYGFAPPDTGEDGALNPFNEYGKTKLAAEQVLRAWQAEDAARRSLSIIRPTVVFGPGNRGNVFNLLSSIARGRFVMIGDGRNRKSMAYVGNLAAFLHCAAGFGPGMHLFNYVDKPDLDMNALVTLVRRRLLGKQGVGLRLPFRLGMAAGHAADVIARASRRNLPVSAIRVRKFCTETSFASAAHGVAGFRAPTGLAEALDLTLQREFLSPDPDAPVFHTE